MNRDANRKNAPATGESGGLARTQPPTSDYTQSSAPARSVSGSGQIALAFQRPAFAPVTSGGKQAHTSRHPCRVCGHWDDTARHRDQRCGGFLAGDEWEHCQRQVCPDYPHDIEGGATYPHPPQCRCQGGQGAGIVRIPSLRPVAAPERLTGEVLDLVLRAYLDRLSLRPTHAAYFASRGAADAAVAHLHGYRSLPTVAEAQGLVAGLVRDFGRDVLVRAPGFWEQHDGVHTLASSATQDDAVIPARDEHGHLTGLVRRTITGSAAKYRNYPGSSGAMYTVAGPDWQPGAVRVLTVVEGIHKAYVSADLSGQRTLGLPGAHLSDAHVAAIQAMQVDIVIEALDGDKVTNEGVGKARATFQRRCQQAGITVLTAEWNAAHGKGLDDLYAGGGRPHILPVPAVMATTAPATFAQVADLERAVAHERVPGDRYLRRALRLAAKLRLDRRSGGEDRRNLTRLQRLQATEARVNQLPGVPLGTRLTAIKLAHHLNSLKERGELHPHEPIRITRQQPKPRTVEQWLHQAPRGATPEEARHWASVKAEKEATAPDYGFDKLTGTSVGTVARAFDDLERIGLIHQHSTGPVMVGGAVRSYSDVVISEAIARAADPGMALLNGLLTWRRQHDGRLRPPVVQKHKRPSCPAHPASGTRNQRFCLGDEHDPSHALTATTGNQGADADAPVDHFDRPKYERISPVDQNDRLHDDGWDAPPEEVIDDGWGTLEPYPPSGDIPTLLWCRREWAMSHHRSGVCVKCGPAEPFTDATAGGG